MTEVFVAYARQDFAVAQRLARTLNDRGLSVWIDADAPDARAFAATLADRLRRADAVLALWTRAGAASPFVRAEAREGLESRRLINLRLPEAPLNPPAPFDRSDFEIFDLPGETDADAEDRWESLVDLILDAGRAYTAWRTPKGAPAAPDPTAARARAASFVRDMEAHPDSRWTPVLDPDGDAFSIKTRDAFASAVYSLACAIDPRWRRALARLGARESRLFGVYEIEDLARRTEPGSAWRRVAGAVFWPLYPVRSLSAYAQSGASEARLDALIHPRLFSEYRPVRTGRPVPPSPLGKGARRKGGGVEPAWWAWPASLAGVLAVGVLLAWGLGAGRGVSVNTALLPTETAAKPNPAEPKARVLAEARPDAQPRPVAGASTTRPALAPVTNPPAPTSGAGDGRSAPSPTTSRLEPIQGAGGGGSGRANTAADVLFELSRREGGAEPPGRELSREDVERIVDDALAKAGKGDTRPARAEPKPAPATDEIGDESRHASLDKSLPTRAVDPGPPPEKTLPKTPETTTEKTTDTTQKQATGAERQPEPEPKPRDENPAAKPEIKAEPKPKITAEFKLEAKPEPKPEPKSELKTASTTTPQSPPFFGASPQPDSPPKTDRMPKPAMETAPSSRAVASIDQDGVSAKAPAPAKPVSPQPEQTSEPKSGPKPKPTPKPEPDPKPIATTKVPPTRAVDPAPAPKVAVRTPATSPAVWTAPTGWLGAEGERLAGLCPRLEPVVHCVSRGETLFRLAERFYGAGCGDLYGVILERNRPVFDAVGRHGDPDLILPGDKLVIPAWPDRVGETNIAADAVACPG